MTHQFTFVRLSAPGGQFDAGLGFGGVDELDDWVVVCRADMPRGGTFGIAPAGTVKASEYSAFEARLSCIWRPNK